MELGLSKLLEEAKFHASQHGKIIGRVTRYRDITINDSEYIGVDIDFENYLDADIKRGQYLAIRSITRPVIILGQVYSISRSDVLARMKIKEVSYHEDPTTIITPAYVEIKPITEAEYYFDGEEWKRKTIRPAVSPVDPQSPVFIPSPDLIKELLNIPSEGVAIGKIYSGGDIIDATVKLDERTLTHHVLVVGTTGAGKTTLLKTIISETIKVNKEEEGKKIKSLIFDRQGDFIRYLIEKGERFAVIMPVVYEKETRKITVQHYANEFIRWYNCDSNINVIKVDEDLDGAEFTCSNSNVFLIPYSINFYRNRKNFNKMTPYFTSRASMHWESLIEKTFEKITQGIDDALNEILGDKNEKKKKIKDEIFNFYMRDYLTPGSLIDKIELNLERFDIDLSKVHRGYKKNFPSTYSTGGSESTKSKISRPYVSIEYDDKNNKRVMIIHTGNAFKSAMDDLEIYYSTRDLIIRVLKAYDRYGIFTVPGAFDLSPEKMDKIFSDYDIIVVDLSWVMNRSASIEAIATIAYKILDDFFGLKDEKYKKTLNGGDLTLIIMDEAHEYFPQSNREDVAKDVVEDLINKIMRLGRVRNIGVILATHVPDDLNPLVLQLTNTKVVMRNEEHILNSIGMEKFKDFLKYAQPGMAIVNSLTFKEVPIMTLLDKNEKRK